MSPLSPMQKLAKKAEKEEKALQSEKYRRRLVRLLPTCKVQLQSTYIHPTAVSAADLLKAKLPGGALSQLRDNGVVVVRTSAPRALWFVSIKGCAGSGLVLLFEDARENTISIWNAENTQEDSLCQIL